MASEISDDRSGIVSPISQETESSSQHKAAQVALLQPSDSEISSIEAASQHEKQHDCHDQSTRGQWLSLWKLELAAIIFSVSTLR